MMTAGIWLTSPVADGEDRIGLERAAQRHVMDRRADDQSDDEVQKRDQQPRDGIALHEFRCPVERPEKGGFGLFPFPPRLGLGVVDGAGGHVAVDGKLLSRHAVERETRAHFGHSRGTLVDDDEVHDQQNAEDDEAHHDRATHHEHREALDHRRRPRRCRCDPPR